MGQGVTETKKPRKSARPAKRGRKPATAAERAAWRNVLLRVRLSDAEARTIAAAAVAQGISVSGYLREAALLAAARG